MRLHKKGSKAGNKNSRLIDWEDILFDSNQNVVDANYFIFVWLRAGYALHTQSNSIFYWTNQENSDVKIASTFYYPLVSYILQLLLRSFNPSSAGSFKTKKIWKKIHKDFFLWSQRKIFYDTFMHCKKLELFWFEK